MPLQRATEVATFFARGIGGVGDVAAVSLHQPDEVIALEGVDRAPLQDCERRQGFPGFRRSRRLTAELQVFSLDLVGLTDVNGPDDGAFYLALVPRPSDLQHRR